MPDTINRFDGEYKFLSNFYEATVVYNGIIYANAEAAFQAQKTHDGSEKQRIAAMQPVQAKRAGRRVMLRSDWEEIKCDEMRSVVTAKFRQNGLLARKLLATGEAELIEGNHWNDTFWGMCNNKGANWLGRILMDLRQRMRRELSGPSQSFYISAKDDSDAKLFVTLYGPDDETDHAKAYLRQALGTNKNRLQGWDMLLIAKQSLEETYVASGIPYRIGATVMTNQIIL